MIDAYDVSLKASKTKLEASQHEAAISKQECTELENKITEMEKEKAVLRYDYEQQAGQLATLQCKGIYEIHTTITAVYTRTYRTIGKMLGRQWLLNFPLLW